MTEIAKGTVCDMNRVCTYRMLCINSVWVRCRGQRRLQENRRRRQRNSSWKITLKFEKFDSTLETDWSSLGGTLGGRLQLLTECIFLLPSTANRLSETVGSFVKTKKITCTRFTSISYFFDCIVCRRRS